MNTINAGKPLPPIIRRGVAEAIILCQNEHTGYVMCPYCGLRHRHGLGGKDSLAGQFREAHCYKGEYQIIGRK